MQIENLQEYSGALVSEFLSQGFHVSIRKEGDKNLVICAKCEGVEHECHIVDTTHLSISKNPKSIAQHDANVIIQQLKAKGA